MGPGEYLTLALNELFESSLFCGTETGLLPVTNAKNVLDGKYRYAGQLVAKAIMQEGPSPCVLTK